MNILKISIIVLGTLAIVLSSLAIGYTYYNTQIKVEYESKPTSYLQEVSNEMVERLRPHYNYTVTNDKKRTVSDILNSSGDCYDYAYVYMEWAKEYPIYAEKVSIWTERNLKHGFVIISNENGYCVLDQLIKPECREFGR